MRFKNKVALVTGGNSGIGLGVAKAFAREGAAVAITGRDDATLASAARSIGGETLAIQADVSKLSDIDAAMGRIKERFGRIDAMFVNAGAGKFVPFDQVTEAFYDELMAVNLKGLFFTVQKALPLMQPGSSVVLNASLNAHKRMPGTTVYGATKAAVVNLARTMSADLIPRGIRVNSVSPGPIESSLLKRLGMTQEQLQQTNDWIKSQVPLKRFGTPEEIAEAVLFLCSPGGGFVVGADLLVDGGMAL
ncbi:MAG TPA: glucose 1-dehydrogenase [Planctomycetota bacterium]|nr:glucose 1-dehydrogenase [Planctomycetota bacterium]